MFVETVVVTIARKQDFSNFIINSYNFLEYLSILKKFFEYCKKNEIKCVEFFIFSILPVKNMYKVGIPA